MTNKEELITYLELEGKGNLTWLDLAIEFNIAPNKSNIQRRKAAQDIWRYYSDRKYLKQNLKKEKIKEGSKILIFDIETTPLLSYHWRLWKQNISHKNQMVKSEWNILSWSAKWLGDDKIMSDILTPKEIKNENDKRLTKQLWYLLDQADIVIAHNLKFDARQCNNRFLKHKLNLPSSYQNLCTYRASKKVFDLPSHSLNYIAKYMGLGSKIDTGGFELWRDCMNGNKKALKEMLLYNEQDVLLLEKVYLKMRPYIKGHPNLALINNVSGCPCCGSLNLKENSIYYTKASKYIEYRCNNCGSLSKNKSAIKSNIENRII